MESNAASLCVSGHLPHGQAYNVLLEDGTPLLAESGAWVLCEGVVYVALSTSAFGVSFGSTTLFIGQIEWVDVLAFTAYSYAAVESEAESFETLSFDTDSAGIVLLIPE